MTSLGSPARIDDPRDPLSKARRDELFKYAKECGLEQVKPDMPATLMRAHLRQAGKTNIQIPPRTLGALPMPTEYDQPDPEAVDADAHAAKQYQIGNAEKQLDRMTRAELAKACKVGGLKMARTDTKEILLEKLRGKQDAIKCD